MGQFTRMRTLLWITILVGFCDAIDSNEGTFNITAEESYFLFGTEDGSIPEFEVVELTNPTRSKRAVASPLDPLVITFKYYGTPTTTRLNIIRDTNLISRTTTGIWIASSKAGAHHGVKYSPRPDVFDNIGTFDLFQNSKDLSAVTRFWAPNRDLTIMGILKQKYAVRNIRLCSKTGGRSPCYYHQPNRNKRSVDSADNDDPNSSVYLVIYKLPEVPLEYFKRQSFGNSTFPDHEASRKKRQLNGDTVYPKLLLSADYSLIGGTSINDFTRHVITHINAVDTMYRSLSNPRVRLRVAGIVIPLDAGAVPYLSKHYERGGHMNAHNVLRSTRKYFYDEDYRFPRDIVDVILMMTKYNLYSRENSGEITPLKGLADMNSACYDVATAIAQYTLDLKGVLVMAHELGHVLGSDHDGDGTSMQCPPDGGYTMAPGDLYARFLTWSPCTKAAFRSFFRSNIGNCMYNRPDEVPNRVKRLPGAWTSINGQCENDFQDVTGVRWKPDPKFCDMYECRVGNRYVLVKHPPLTGTRNRYGQRCISGIWN